MGATGMVAFFAEAIRIFRGQWPAMLVLGLLAVSLQDSQRWLSLQVIGGVAGIATAFVLALIVQAVLQGLILRKILEREHLTSGAAGIGLWRWSAVTIVLNIVLPLATMALIVPGILLFLIWYLAPIVALAQGTGIRASFSESRSITKGHRSAIFFSLLLTGLLLGGLYFGLVEYAGDFKTLSRRTLFSKIDVLHSVLMGSFAIASAALNLGVYARLSPRASQFTDIFD